MEIKKRKCFTINEDTDVLIGKILRLSNYDSASDMLRQLVEREAVRLGIISGEVTQEVSNNSDFTNLYNKVSLLITVSKDSNDKLYVLLDCLNNLMQYMEIGGDFKSAHDDTAHEFIKQSIENLDRKKHIAQLNKY